MATTIGLGALALGCSDVGAQPSNSGHGGDSGESGGASTTTGGSSGGSAAGTAGGGSAGVGVSAPAAGAGSGGGAGSSPCSPACGGATAICDQASSSCKRCTAFEGCPSDKPLCDTAASAGLGECMPLEVLAIYTEYEQNPDLAHRSYAREANDWLGAAALASGYSYEATTDWQRLEAVVPARGRILMFLDDKPAVPAQRASFESYMNSGGAWIGCHYAAYNSSPSDWDWYFNQFLGAGAHAGNTWRPTSAQLRVEDPSHPLAQGLEAVITAAPNEWYAWTTDLTTQSAIKILLSIDPSSFPLGTGPKPEEIWHSGYYPVVWTNTTYKMVYINMGHDDIDYEGGTLQSLSSTFSSSAQNRMLLNAIQWLSAAQ